MAPSRKHSFSRTSISYSSRKRRRVSLASVDLSRELQQGTVEEIRLGTSVSFLSLSTRWWLTWLVQSDRFIPSRPKQSLPLNATPRTTRVAKAFELADSRMLNFSEPSTPSSSSSLSLAPPALLSQLRRSASLLNIVPTKTCLTSASANLKTRSGHILALDGSGMPADVFSFPFSWSSNNVIAVTCGMSIYTQQLDTKTTSRLCTMSNQRFRGSPNSIEWGGRESGKQDTLAVGTTRGVVELWDAGASPSRVRLWMDLPPVTMSGISWHDETFAVGRGDGKISLFDPRRKRAIQILERGHKGSVLGVKWNQDGRYIASGDESGQVFIWDTRVGRPLADRDAFRRGRKMKHGGAVKASTYSFGREFLLIKADSGMVSMEAGPAGNGKRVPRWRNPNLECNRIFLFLWHSAASSYAVTQYLCNNGPLVTAL